MIKMMLEKEWLCNLSKMISRNQSIPSSQIAQNKGTQITTSKRKSSRTILKWDWKKSRP
jgi:hypothetical protein